MGIADAKTVGCPPHQCRAQRSAAAPARKHETLGVVIPAPTELGIQQSQAVGASRNVYGDVPLQVPPHFAPGAPTVGLPLHWVGDTKLASQPRASFSAAANDDVQSAAVVGHDPGSCGVGRPHCCGTPGVSGSIASWPIFIQAASKRIRVVQVGWCAGKPRHGPANCGRWHACERQRQKHAVLQCQACQFWGEHRGSIGRDGYGAALNTTSHYAICVCSNLLQCHRCWQFPISTSHAACKARAYRHRYSIAALFVRPSLHGLWLGPFCTVSVKRGCVACASGRLTLHHCQGLFFATSFSPHHVNDFQPAVAAQVAFVAHVCQLRRWFLEGCDASC